MSTLKVGGIRGVSASSDAITVANDGTCTANVTNNLSNRNKVGNGAMLCAQRGTSHSPGASSQIYTLDRFQHIATTGVAFDATVTQDSSAPVGDQLDLLWHAIDADADLKGKFSAFYNSIKAVKDANPKP